MVNSNGSLVADEKVSLSINNRGFTYGDSLFETLRIQNGNILFWEDHYFRLMASMRILRMQIPMTFTPEFLEEEIKTLVIQNGLVDTTARVKIQVNRGFGGFYTPTSKEVEYTITAVKLEQVAYQIAANAYEVSLFKDHYVSKDLLSTLKSNNKIVNILGSIYANDNGFDNCFLMNTDKMIVEALNGNVFIRKGSVVKTPPLSDGCLKGVMRTQLLRFLKNLSDYELKEESISPFELQKADEVFITNVIKGIVPVSKYRKKSYDVVLGHVLLEKLKNSL